MVLNGCNRKKLHESKDITGRKTNVKQKQLLQSVWGWYLSWRLLVFLGDGFNIWVLQQWGVIRWSPVSKISFLGYCHLANSFWEIEQGRMVLLHKRWPLFTECHVHKEEQGSQAASHLKHVTAMKTGLKKKKKCKVCMNKIHPFEQLCGNRLLNWPLPVGGAQWTVGRYGDALRVAVVDQFLLGQVWVAFDLGGHKQRQKQGEIAL